MKTFKLLTILTTATLVLFACSEGSYVPATNTQPVVAQATPVPVGVNPYLTNPTTYYNGLNPQAQAGLQNTVQQNLQSCAARSTPNFYAFTSQNQSNVAVRWQPAYTPNNCACIQAPCNCEQVLAQLRTQCGVETVSDASSRGSYASDSHGNPQGGEEVLYSNGSSESSSTACDPVTGGINENSKTLALTITGADAKALYDRLAKAEEKVANKTSTKVRTGANYKCMMDGSGKENQDYACDFDVSVADGLVYQEFPVSANGTAVISGPVHYEGSNVTVGGTGLNPDEAIITIEGAPAANLYRRMTVKAVNGTDPDLSGSAAMMKLGKHVNCYQSMPTDSVMNTCRLKVNATTGVAEISTLTH